jgi:hypothetical protein
MIFKTLCRKTQPNGASRYCIENGLRNKYNVYNRADSEIWLISFRLVAPYVN